MSSPGSLVVVGGGAAGFFCAVNAARMNPRMRVTLLEKSDKLLAKVKVSGGGRCNLTHSCFDILEMSRCYPRGQHFVRKAFHRFFTTDTIRWFEERGVRIKTEKDGRMFPVSDSSQTVIDCLLREADLYGVGIRKRTEVTGLRKEGGRFMLETGDKTVFFADYICVASGGYPKSALSDWLRSTGHYIESPVPSLFTFNLPTHPITGLTGLSVERVRVKIAGSKQEQEGPLLITHWGLSGPVVLKLSAWAARELAEKNYDFHIRINWIPGRKEQEIREWFNDKRLTSPSQLLCHRGGFGLPNRLWEFLARDAGVKAGMRWADLPAPVLNKFIRSLTDQEVHIKGKTTFKEEFVTAGGISTGEVDANTMMSKKIPGLFFAGEVLDVDGITGGYNFQHAWTSGWIAASSIAALSA